MAAVGNPSLTKLLECPVCLDEMRPPVKIFQCSNGHAICEHCKDNPNVKLCPTCRVVFTRDNVTRNILAESMAEAATGNPSQNASNVSTAKSTLSEPPKNTGNSKPGVLVRAMYDFQAAGPDELSFKSGDEFEQLEDENEQGWCKGRKDGRVGLYPANFVHYNTSSPSAQPMDADLGSSMGPAAQRQGDAFKIFMKAEQHNYCSAPGVSKNLQLLSN